MQNWAGLNLNFNLENRFKYHLGDAYRYIYNDNQEYSNPLAIKFLDDTPYVLLCDNDGNLHIINHKYITLYHKYKLHDNSIFDIDVSSNILYTASGDKTIKIWDIKQDFTFIFALEGHYGSVKSIDVCKENENVIVSGSRDGSIRIWDRRNPLKASDVIYNAHMPNKYIHQTAAITTKTNKAIIRSGVTKLNTPHKIAHSKSKLVVCNHKYSKVLDIVNPAIYKHFSVTCVLFQTDNRMYSCGASDDKIKVWDLRKTHQINDHGIPCESFSPCANLNIDDSPTMDEPEPLPNVKCQSFTDLKFDTTKTYLYANSYQGERVHVFDLTRHRNKHVRDYYKSEGTSDHKDSSSHCSLFYDKIDLSPCDMFLLSGSGYGRCHIWNTSETFSQSHLLVNNHTSEISNVAWKDLDKFAITDDKSIQIWNINQPPATPISPDRGVTHGSRVTANRTTQFKIPMTRILSEDHQQPYSIITNELTLSPIGKSLNTFPVKVVIPTPTTNLPNFNYIKLEKSVAHYNFSAKIKRLRLNNINNSFESFSQMDTKPPKDETNWFSPVTKSPLLSNKDQDNKENIIPENFFKISTPGQTVQLMTNTPQFRSLDLKILKNTNNKISKSLVKTRMAGKSPKFAPKKLKFTSSPLATIKNPLGRIEKNKRVKLSSSIIDTKPISQFFYTLTREGLMTEN